ncbi:MAG TPA: LamG-like jellyroll fold domain-containing protein [Thermoguttaceae bacterium]|nr:LamG-like jellyroll fold domain-containing protein [Thermoguttaceae bacterium]
MTIRCLFIACVILFSTRCHAAIDTIIPLPKEIRAVGKPIPLEGFGIVAAGDEQSLIGAAEINQRIVSLGGQPLPVSRLDGRLPEGRWIVVAPCTAKALAAVTPPLDVSPDQPGPQGYAIRPTGSDDDLKLLLVGSDSLGTLYAAVTFRQLIIQQEGRLEIQPAAVRDWPDFKTRCNGAPFSENLRGDWYGILSAEAKGDVTKARQLAEGWVAAQKRHFDWFLRAKINMAWNRTSIDPGDAPEKTTIARAALKEVHDYGWKRGIVAIDADTTSIGRFPRDQDNADFNGCVLSKSHGKYFCWSRLDYHQRRAERAAQWLADCGYRGYYLHATDSGGWANPALWDERCDECRKNYGDDHAKADATVFGIYYDAIKQRIPDAKFVAVVYPYTGRYLDPENIYRDAASAMGQGDAARGVAERATEKLTDFLERLNSLLPPDIAICIRESERKDLDLVRRAWGRRPFYLYYEYAFWKGWRPYFLTSPLMTRSLYYPDYDDILFGNVSGSGWRELTQLLGVECAWHVDRPGSADFDSARWHDWAAVGDVPPERQAFAQRACRFWFGEQAGPLIAPAFAENISHEYICFPEEVLDQVKLADPVRTMQEQAAAAARAAASLDKLWTLQQQSPVLLGDEYAYFLNLYQMTHAARILAEHRAAMMAARLAIQQSDRPEALRQQAAARSLLDQDAPAWSALNRQIPQNRRLTSPTRKTSTAGLLSTLDPAELRKEIDDLTSRMDELIAAHTIPGWFERDCRKRELIAVRTTEPVTVDGHLEEVVWHNAPRIEHFVDWRQLRLESLETVGQLAYDDRTLYVAMECFDPNPSEISTAMRGADQYQLCDSVEVLVAPRGGADQFAHWIVDSHGTIFDARTERTDDGRIQYTAKWNGNAQVKVSRDADRWTVELAIPREDIDMRLEPGATARILLCRNIVHTRPDGEHEQNAVVFLDGDKFQTVEKFATLQLGDTAAPSPEAQVDVTLRPVTFGHETIGDGSGTYFGGDFVLETDHNLHDARITAEYTDGVRPLGSLELGAAPLIQLRWSPKQSVRIGVPIEVPGVVCTFVVDSREGTWRIERRFGSPRRPEVSADQLFAPGIDGRALAMPAHFSSLDPPKLNVEEGTIEFWIQPAWDVVPHSSGPRGSLEHTLLNIGPVRPEHLYLSNHSSLTISHVSSGNLSAILSNPSYESRTLDAGIRDWRVGQWHHVALQWKLDDSGKTAMALYVDGRLASDRCVGSAKSPNDRPLTMKPLPFPIQVGSMNTGYRPADAPIEELRISAVRRYSEPFVPAKRLDADSATPALFHFDGDLGAETPAGCQAVAGPVQ